MKKLTFFGYKKICVPSGLFDPILNNKLIINSKIYNFIIKYK